MKSNFCALSLSVLFLNVCLLSSQAEEVAREASFNSVVHFSIALRAWAVGKGELEFHSPLTIEGGSLRNSLTYWTVSVPGIEDKFEIILGNSRSSGAYLFETEDGGVYVMLPPAKVVEKYLRTWKEQTVESWFADWEKTELQLRRDEAIRIPVPKK